MRFPLFLETGRLVQALTDKRRRVAPEFRS
jgi:hypothetical protein